MVIAKIALLISHYPELCRGKLCQGSRVVVLVVSVIPATDCDRGKIQARSRSVVLAQFLSSLRRQGSRIGAFNMKSFFVYIMSSKRNGTLYIGVTNNIARRVYEHKNNLIKGFTTKYRVHHLVYVGEADDINAAMAREKQLKKWKRMWKLRLIESVNPEWKDLY